MHQRHNQPELARMKPTIPQVNWLFALQQNSRGFHWAPSLSPAPLQPAQFTHHWGCPPAQLTLPCEAWACPRPSCLLLHIGGNGFLVLSTASYNEVTPLSSQLLPPAPLTHHHPLLAPAPPAPLYYSYISCAPFYHSGLISHSPSSERPSLNHHLSHYIIFFAAFSITWNYCFMYYITWFLHTKIYILRGQDPSYFVHLCVPVPQIEM